MVESEQPFQLKPGEYATLKGGPLRMVFDRVVQDSRCPKGEQCLVAGTATVRFVVDGTTDKARTLDLRIPDRAAASLSPDGPYLHLLRLDPYPISGRFTPPDRYQATLVIRTAGTDAER